MDGVVTVLGYEIKHVEDSGVGNKLCIGGIGPVAISIYQYYLLFFFC